jgi:hypothetical protein
MWVAIRNITKKKELLISVKTHEWVNCFQELFSINSERILEGLEET